MQNTEAVIFDLGGVILNIDYNLTRTAFEKLGIKNFHEMYSLAVADDLFVKLETGKIFKDDFYKEINKRAGLNLPFIEIEKAWNAMLRTFRENSLLFLESLKLRYQLFLLSNTNHIHLAEFNKIYFNVERVKPFDKYFDRAYYSCNIGLRKPDKDIYEFLLKENNLDAGKTIFIDDSIQNVEAAEATGISGILLEQGMLIENLGL